MTFTATTVWVSLASTGLLCLVAWWVLTRIEHRSIRSLLLLLTSILLALSVHPGVWNDARTGYPSDSFHTLESMAALSLIGVSTTIAILLLSFARLKTLALQATRRSVQNTPRRTRIDIALAALDQTLNVLGYWLGISLVPQLYYFFYQRVFPDLPDQLVIDGLVPWQRYLDIIALHAGDSLANHFTGLLLWILLIATAISWLLHINAYHRRVAALLAVVLLCVIGLVQSVELAALMT